MPKQTTPKQYAQRKMRAVEQRHRCQRLLLLSRKGCVYSNSTWDNNLGSRRHVVDASDFERMYAGKIASSEYNRAKDAAEHASRLIGIVPETQKLVTCGYVKDAFRAISVECDADY